MTLFSKVTDKNVKVTALWCIPEVGFIFTEAHTVVRPSKYKNAYMVCSWRYPAGKHSAADVRGESESGVFKLCREEMWEIYTIYRRAYASGYETSEIFNFYGVDLPNQHISSSCNSAHMTFDIRLGHAIYLDFLASRYVGGGLSSFPC
jgi:hypothetical protein